MEDLMPDLIKRLDTWLRENRAGYYSQLLPALTDEKIIEFEEALGVSLPPDFKLFYKWKNGQPSGNYDSFIFNLTLMPDQEILEAVQIGKELLECGDFDRENWWSSKWIPFLSNGGGNHYCLDLEGTFSGKVGQILEFIHDDSLRPLVHESFLMWLQTTVKAFESGLFQYDEQDGMQARDWDTYCAFHRENNPGYPVDYEAG